MVVAGSYAFQRVARQAIPTAEVPTTQMLQRKVSQQVNLQLCEDNASAQKLSERKTMQVADPRMRQAVQVRKKAETTTRVKTAATQPLADPAPVAAPFVCDFDTEESFINNWTTVDANSDGTTWTYDGDNGFAILMYNSTLQSDDYLVTANPITLASGDAYVAIDFGGASTSYYESIEILYGTSPDVNSMTTIESYIDYQGGYIYSEQIALTIPEDGDYYFAIHGCSEPDQYYAFIDKIEINSGKFIGQADLGVMQVTLPAPSPSLTSSETVSVAIGNYGTCDVSSYSLSMSVECNGSQQTSPLQTVDETLTQGNIAIVELDMPADMSAAGVYTVTVTVSDVVPAGDGREEEAFDNNSLSASTTHFGTTDVPFVTDFSAGEQPEAWSSNGSWEYVSDYQAIACIGNTPLYSQGVNLEAGKSYRIEYNYMAGYDFLGFFTYTESFTLSCGIAGEEMSVIDEAIDDYTGDAFVDREATFNCEQSGVYQFAFAQDEPAGSFFISSISISEITGCDLAITSISGCPTMLPTSQSAQATVVVANRGAGSYGGTLSVIVDGSTIATATVPSIASGSTTTVPIEFALSSASAGTAADVEFEVEVTGGEDGNAGNNTVTATITATEEVLAYDHTTDGMYIEDYCIGVGGGAYVGGTQIHLATEDVLTGISIGWGAADGQDIELSLYKFDPTAIVEEGAYLLGEQVLAVQVNQGTENGQIDYAINPRVIEPGDYLLCVGCSGYCLVTDMVTPGSLYLISGDYVIDQSSANLGTPAIRAIFGEGEPIAHDLMVDGILSPDGEGIFASNQPIVVQVTNNGSETANGTIEVTVNGTALEAQAVTLEGYASASYTFTADMATPGDYTIVATATLEGDENPDNNSVEKTVTSAEPLDPYTMDFEGCADFAIDNFNPAWISVDGDQSEVYGHASISFPMPEDYTLGFIAFNPYNTTPSLYDMYGTAPYGGQRFGASFAATSLLNDDWLISPLLLMPDEGAALEMQVQSYTDDYGLELYEVCVSTTDNDPASFTVVASGSAPAGEWTQVDVDLSEYAGQNVYVAIHCVSEDAFIFMVDDIIVSKPASGVGTIAIDKSLSLYPNPVSETLVISSTGSEIESVAIYSASGAMVGSATVGSSELRYNVTGLADGIYVAKVQTADGTQAMRFIVK